MDKAVLHTVVTERNPEERKFEPFEYQEEETSRHGGLMSVKSSCGAEMSVFKE